MNPAKTLNSTHEMQLRWRPASFSQPSIYVCIYMLFMLPISLSGALLVRLQSGVVCKQRWSSDGDGGGGGGGGGDADALEA